MSHGPQSNRLLDKLMMMDHFHVLFSGSWLEREIVLTTIYCEFIQLTFSHIIHNLSMKLL